MKNIHLLPTDKLRTYKGGKVSTFTAVASMMPNESVYNIYITSDEEIKEGDWVYCNDDNTVIQLETNLSVILANQQKEKYGFKTFYKIILTTDPQLIQDGVQAIDDEFLEWFVQNPTCEEVEVGGTNKLIDNYGDKDGYKWEVEYHIYIPKEEPKIEFVNNTLFSNPISFELDMEDFEEPKQERLEDIQLDKVLGSRMCQYTVIENKLAILYKNQEQILKAIKLLSNQNEETPKEELSPEDLMIKWCEETSKNKNILEVVANKDELNHIEWIYSRMVNIHNENENYDYMVKFKNIIEKLNKL
jgi:hypothetical protein